MKHFALVLLLVMPLFAIAQEPAAPTKETDEQRFVRLTREFEQRGFRDGPDPTLDFLVAWGLGESGYQAVECEMVGPYPRDVLSAFSAASIFGNLAWQMEHGKDTDELSKQYAGLVTGLRVYNATVAHDPTFPRSAFVDSLVERLEAGTLREFMAPYVAKNCVGDNTPIVPPGGQSDLRLLRDNAGA